MPIYRFKCPNEHYWEQWCSIHGNRPPQACPECGIHGQRVFTPPNISVYATPHKGADARRVDQKEHNWDKDLPAYKSLRNQGYQPRMIDGCDQLSAMAKERHEINLGKVWKTDEQRSVARDTFYELKENDTKSNVEKLGQNNQVQHARSA